MKHLEKLIEIGGPSLSPLNIAMPQSVRDKAGSMASELERLLTRKNGFVAFESSLHILSLGAVAMDCTLDEWNKPDLWRDAYGRLASEGLYFAEDAFGNQFCVREGKVCAFDAETAEMRIVSPGLEQWAEVVLGDYAYWSGFPLAHDWQLQNGPLPTGSRLVPKQPFVIGGEYALQNLRAVSAVRGMRWRGGIAKQIHELPNGSPVRLQTLD
jgi:hypothetical protein